MYGQEQDMLFFGQAQELGAKQRPLCQIEGLPGLLGCQMQGFSLPLDSR